MAYEQRIMSRVDELASSFMYQILPRHLDLIHRE